MNRPKRRSWKIWVFTLVLGLTGGIIYYAVMSMSAKPTTFTPLIDLPTDSAPPLAVPAPTTGSSSPADVPRLSIPTVGVSGLIVQLPITGNSWAVYGLGMNIGHLVGTSPLFGQGNTVLVGHVEMADGSAGIFSGIRNMKAGEPILLDWHGVQREYGVSSISTVSPDDVSVLYPSDKEQLTLITCSDYDFLANTYLQRVVVVAERVMS